MQPPGDFSRSMITNVPADLASEEALFYKETIQRFPEEAIYIYSFKQNRMIYADGWEEVLGYKDAEINILTIVSITSPEYALFANELNDKALMFVMSKTEDLEKYSFTIELKKIHKNGTHVPLIVRGCLKSPRQPLFIRVPDGVNFRIGDSRRFKNLLRRPPLFV